MICNISPVANRSNKLNRKYKIFNCR